MIEVKNVTKKYGKAVAVDDISFTIKEGEIIGLLGPNGAGKSTTMNMITGFIEPTQGEIIINGYDILRKPKKAKREIGYMPEGVPLYMDLTVKEFITYMAELRKVDKKEKNEKIKKIIEDMNLKEVQNRLTKLERDKEKDEVMLLKMYEDQLEGKITESMYNTLSKRKTIEIEEAKKQIFDVKESIKKYEEQLRTNESKMKDEKGIIKRFLNSKIITQDLLNQVIDKIYVGENDEIDIKFTIEDLNNIKTKKV